MSSNVYSAPDTYLREMQMVRAPDRPEEVVTFTNPVMEFETLGTEMSRNSIYQNWERLSKEQRLAHVDVIARPAYPVNPPPSEMEKAVAWKRWHRNLCFIFHEETRARKDGWDEVARKVAALLVPMPKR